MQDEGISAPTALLWDQASACAYLKHFALQDFLWFFCFFLFGRQTKS